MGRSQLPTPKVPGVIFFLRSGVIAPSQSALPSSYAALRAAPQPSRWRFRHRSRTEAVANWVTPSYVAPGSSTVHTSAPTGNIHVAYALSHVGKGGGGRLEAILAEPNQRQSAYADCAPWRSRPPLDDPAYLGSFSFFRVTGGKGPQTFALAPICRARPWKSHRSKSATSPSSEGCQLPRRPRQRSTVSEKTSGTSTAPVASALTRPGPMPLQPAARRAT